jgi:succinyl-diaminopimelate desuccinylase
MPNSVTELLADLVRIPSVNPMGRDLDGPEFHEGRLTEYLASFFEQLGVPYEVIEVVPSQSSNVIARYDSPGSDFDLLLDAHQDTVPVDGMTIPPFEPTIKDGRLYGRGSTDVKGGMAAMLWAFQRIVQDRPANATNIIMSCTCDEEATTTGISDLVSLWSDGDKPSPTTTTPRSKLVTRAPNAGVIAEPTLLDVVVAHRGATRFKIHTHGRACHSSEPSNGVNAIYRMARVLELLEQYAATVGDKFTQHPLCGAATLSVGLINGGASVNVVPDGCTIEVDRRVIPGESATEAYDDIVTFLNSQLDFEITIDEPYLNGPTLNDDANAWISDPLLTVIEEVVGPRSAIGVPFGTHASRTEAGGVPSVVFGPGSIEQAHTKDEWIEIDQLEKASEVYYRFCANAGRSLV